MSHYTGEVNSQNSCLYFLVGKAYDFPFFPVQYLRIIFDKCKYVFPGKQKWLSFVLRHQKKNLAKKLFYLTILRNVY